MASDESETTGGAGSDRRSERMPRRGGGRGGGRGHDQGVIMDGQDDGALINLYLVAEG